MGYPSGCQTRVGSQASCTPLGLHPLAALEPYARNAVISTSPNVGASSLAVDVRITSFELSFRATCSPTRILGPEPACPPPRTPRAARLARAPPPQSGARLSGAPAVRLRLARCLEGWREDGRGARPAPLTRSARHYRPSPPSARTALFARSAGLADASPRPVAAIDAAHFVGAAQWLRLNVETSLARRRSRLLSAAAVPSSGCRRASEPSGSYSTRPLTPSMSRGAGAGRAQSSPAQ